MVIGNKISLLAIQLLIVSFIQACNVNTSKSMIWDGKDLLIHPNEISSEWHYRSGSAPRKMVYQNCTGWHTNFVHKQATEPLIVGLMSNQAIVCDSEQDAIEFYEFYYSAKKNTATSLQTKYGFSPTDFIETEEAIANYMVAHQSEGLVIPEGKSSELIGYSYGILTRADNIIYEFSATIADPSFTPPDMPYIISVDEYAALLNLINEKVRMALAQ